MSRRPISLCHWGPFEAEVSDGRLVRTAPMEGSGADPDMIGAWPELLYSETRIREPHIRASWLEGKKAGRGRDPLVPVGWDEALSHVAAELARVHRDFGPASIFGGSYGWSSAGRFHHARTQIRRFLAATGGFTDQLGNYSWGAAQMILPHILGSHAAVSSAATSWASIAEHTDTLVAFGGLKPANWNVTSGGAGSHHLPEAVLNAKARGTRFVLVTPHAGDAPDGLDAEVIAPRPHSDTAIMLSLARQAVASGRADPDFLARHTHGADRFLAYLAGETDGQEKTLAWGAEIAGLPVEDLERLWSRIAEGRVMLTASWSLQRAENGEQTYWALIALAALLGQIGLPGGGFSFGYGSMNGVGADARSGLVPTMPGLPNPVPPIPTARFADAFLNPGRSIDFNGHTVVYPDIRLVYWAGGNPFHHHQDLCRMEKAWAVPETVIVHEPWWTPTARRADIVLPATTSLERRDIGGSSRDPSVFFMPKLVEPVGEARSDFSIFSGLADRLGCGAAYHEGLDEEGWLRRLWDVSLERAEKAGIDLPDFETASEINYVPVSPPAEPEVLLSAFRADPEAAALGTPSGRIELYSEAIAAMGYADSPPHPAWRPPLEWAGAAEEGELHLLTNQPAKQLHAQLYPVMKDGDGPAACRIAPGDARARGIEDGDLVRLHNGRGACRARAVIDDGLRPGVLLMSTGAWYDPDPEGGPERAGNPNVLTADRPTSSLAQATAAQSALVRIEGLDRERT
ncbi:molybdopterin-dependent oxidoreductase [Roseicyclus sp. F158]|uniref:Molybdopterin-dependent oxidoreductase n=1 Tax=Tropicimonas omnivorans TaxID=3075590 RepID=A0ABU3DKV7_9RHOB|nr:molybdopterin-dependent oxidoreductase [Roseicyclus sp. F158]MDT0684356.1 molybdopterin-dependent oxidoreductase [Roseicyclus sp. F158]